MASSSWMGVSIGISGPRAPCKSTSVSVCPSLHGRPRPRAGEYSVDFIESSVDFLLSSLYWHFSGTMSPFRMRAKALENLVSFECLWLSVPQNALQRIPPYVDEETPWPFSWANFRQNKPGKQSKKMIDVAAHPRS